MKLSNRYNTIERIIRDHYKNEIVSVSHNIRGRIRVLFNNRAIPDIRYPTKNSYSYYLNYNELMYRIDTAPHHKGLNTYPNHCHFEYEENINSDRWTNTSNTLEENILALILWLDYIFSKY